MDKDTESNPIPAQSLLLQRIETFLNEIETFLSHGLWPIVIIPGWYYETNYK